MATKSSQLNLYASDDLDVLAFDLQVSAAKALIQTPTMFEVNSAKISFTGNADSAKDIDDVSQYLVDREAARAAKFAEEEGRNDANAAAIAAETATRTSTFNSQQALIASEVTRASGVESGLQGQITSEISTRQSTYDSLEADIAAEVAARAAAVSAATSQATSDINNAKALVQSGDAALNARIDDILQGAGLDYDTIKEIQDAYELKDTEIVGTIATLRADFDALKLKYDTAFPQDP